MAQQSTSPRSVSSHLGRHWLTMSVQPNDTPVASLMDLSDGSQTDDQLMADRLGELSYAETTATASKIASVAMPDVSVQPASPLDTASAIQDPRAVAKSLANASEERLKQLGRMIRERQSSTNPTLNAIQDSVFETVAQSLAEISPQSSDVFSEAPEPTESWTTPSPPQPRQTPAPVKTPVHTPTDVSNQFQIPNESNSPVATSDVDAIVESIMDKYPDNQSVVLLFVGSENNPAIDTTSANVAASLSRLRTGEVLLIDADQTSRGLTNSSGAAENQGIADVVLESQDWRQTICAGAATGVDFLPVGQRSFENTRFQKRVRSVLNEIRNDYRYICVSAGSSDGLTAKLWSDICDGCYLLVSIKNSNPLIAQSAVAELQSSGARLLGCVVSDVEN